MTWTGHIDPDDPAHRDDNPVEERELLADCDHRWAHGDRGLLWCRRCGLEVFE